MNKVTRVEKMRRSRDRNRAADAGRREQSERREWLGGMTPEHRAQHEKQQAIGWVCYECVSINIANAVAPLVAMQKRLGTR